MMRAIVAGLGLLAAVGAPAKAEELHIQHCLHGCPAGRQQPPVRLLPRNTQSLRDHLVGADVLCTGMLQYDLPHALGSQILKSAPLDLLLRDYIDEPARIRQLPLGILQIPGQTLIRSGTDALYQLKIRF